MNLAFVCLPSCLGNNWWPVTRILAQLWGLGRQTWASAKDICDQIAEG